MDKKRPYTLIPVGKPFDDVFDEVRYLMSEQNGTHVSAKPHRNRQASIQKTTIQRPANDDKEAWEAFWKAQGQPWRTEPEIDFERQLYLEERRNTIKPDIEQGIYPFKDIDQKLSRADVEWLLATHENGRGPVNWNDESQRERDGLDLRGADLSRTDLSRLPLACLRGGLSRDEINSLSGTDFEEATWSLHLEGANLDEAYLENANLFRACLEGASLVGAHLEVAILSGAQLKGAYLNSAFLMGALIAGANLEEAALSYAHLEEANLSSSSLGKAYFYEAYLDGTNLKEAILNNVRHIGPYIADVHWSNINLSVVEWSQVYMLGEEYEARQKFRDRKLKDRDWRLAEYQAAARANRQLSVVLRNQGLNEDAARFAYRAQLMQRKVYWLQRKFLSFLGSLFLDLLSGYGYKVGRCFIAYALVIGVFAMIYHLLGTHPTWNEAIVISMTAFHGRGFFPDQFHPGDPQALAAAIEALVGLLIEITLIATLTQRFFGK